MRLNPESLARASSRHPWRTIVVWAAVVVVAGFASQQWLSGVLTTDIDFTNDPESRRAMTLIEEHVTGPQGNTEFLIVASTDGAQVSDPAFQAYVQQVQAAATELGDAVVAPPLNGAPTSVLTVYDMQGLAAQETDPARKGELEAQAAGLISTDGTGTLVPVPVVDGEIETVDRLKELVADNHADGFELLLAGPATLNADTTEIAEEDLRQGELLGVAIALVVLIVVFGALIAALLPISIALVSIPIAFGGVAVMGHLFDLQFSIFTTNMASMIGLAVGIDYALFIVARYREERRKGFDPSGAIGASGATASRAVFFSGMTVVLALLGMFIIPTTIFRSMATGAIFVVLVSIAASMTLLPALLGLLKDRINWPRLGKRAKQAGDPDPRGGFWDRWTRTVMGAPVVSLVVSVTILGGLAAVYFTIDKGTSQSAASLPDDVESKRAFLVLTEDFAAGGRTDPVEVVVEGDLSDPATQEEVGALQSAIAADDAFASQAPVIESQIDGSAFVVQAIPTGDAFGSETFAAVQRLRDDVLPSIYGQDQEVALVGGMPAIFYDFVQQTDEYQWIVFAFVLGLSFLLLMTVFRSIVVPAKAVVMNLLSVGAAYGAVVLVFQHGVGIGVINALPLFEFQQVDAIEAWLPLFLFSILFGLSMDYHVFLLSRIREEYDKTGDNDESVAYGLRTTAGIITGAAVIMVAVFTSFAAGRLAMLQQMGFGLAVAVFMDATIVRSVLVPASMKLLGDRNWYLPKWLQWLPNLNVEGHEPDVDVQVPDTVPDLVEAGGGE